MTTLHRPHRPRGGTRSVQPALRLVLLLLATAQLMLVLDVTVVNVALPDIGADLGLSAPRCRG